MPITQHPFGTTHNGIPIERFILRNAGGMEAAIMTYGGIITALRVPDRRGAPANVVLGFDTLTPYLGEHPYFGALIGRYGNRIARGRFELDGVPYELARNNGPNHLHGGPHGFHQVVWQARPRLTEPPSVELSYESAAGEEGYPGTLSVTVVYTLSDNNALQIDYTATTDQPTVINLTNHSYFNLAGSGDVLKHHLQINAARFVPIDATLIPLGELRFVRNTPFDFTTPTPIGATIEADDEQIGFGEGFDHTWVLDHPAGTLGHAATVYEPNSGRAMEVHTTQPGVQFYSGNQLDGSLIGPDGTAYTRRSGLCLETQHFPDSPNQPRFPSTVLRPGETYRQQTIYRFFVHEQ